MKQRCKFRKKVRQLSEEIWVLLKNMWPASGLMRWLLLSFLAYSVLCFFCAVFMEFTAKPYYPPSEAHLEFVFPNQIPRYRSYFEKWNWLLFPFFFLIIGVIAKFTWDPFQEAWRRAANNAKSIVKNSEGNVITQENAGKLTSKLEKIRNVWLLAIAGLCALLFFYFDSAETREIYFTARNYGRQMEIALKDPDFTVKWLFEEAPRSANADSIAPPLKQIIFTFMLELEQMFLIGLGFLVLFQMLLQTFCFAALEQFSVNGVAYSVHLDPERPSNDFGLGDWNKALDIASWALAPGLCITVVSMLSQPGGSKDIGQRMGVWALGLLFAALLLPTIGGRRRWMNECQRRLEEEDNNEQAWKRFHQQNPWPMDPRRMQNLGFTVSISLFAIFAGIEVGTLIVRFFLK